VADREPLVAGSDGGEHGPVPFDVERLLRLWTDPLPEDDATAAEAFRQLYTDPVTANGAPLTAGDLVGRARTMQAALERPEREVLGVADAGDVVAVAFRLAGRHVGPLDTPAGRLPASGVRLDLRIIDLLTLTDGRVSAIRMVADWLSALAPAGLVHVPSDGAQLALTAVLPLSPERLFPFLVTPDELARWWGPHGFTTPEVQLDPTPGGRYRLTMQPPDGDAFHVSGEFHEVDAPRRLSFSFRYEEPSPDDRETVVVLTLTPADDGTELSLSQGPFATDERRQLHRTGWTESLERLRVLAESRGP
jgi:uncharacterized protein YndB with AHSA1/START domain